MKFRYFSKSVSDIISNLQVPGNLSVSLNDLLWCMPEKWKENIENPFHPKKFQNLTTNHETCVQE